MIILLSWIVDADIPLTEYSPWVGDAWIVNGGLVIQIGLIGMGFTALLAYLLSLE